jgi:hypothetical protein
MDKRVNGMKEEYIGKLMPVIFLSLTGLFLYKGMLFPYEI